MESKQKHALEPWNVSTDINGVPIVMAYKGNISYSRIAQLQMQQGAPVDQEYMEANAERIAICVNFLAGIPTENLKMWSENKATLQKLLTNIYKHGTEFTLTSEMMTLMGLK